MAFVHLGCFATAPFTGRPFLGISRQSLCPLLEWLQVRRAGFLGIKEAGLGICRTIGIARKRKGDEQGDNG